MTLAATPRWRPTPKWPDSSIRRSTGSRPPCSSSPRRTSPRPAVLAASGSVLTNKYAEGYPGRRYYGGNQIIDEVEDLARDRATALFGAEHANVQPHAGANANLAVYQALLEPGDTILAMRLDHGGPPDPRLAGLHHLEDLALRLLRRDAGQPSIPTSPGEIIDFDQVADVARREQPTAHRGRLHRLRPHHRSRCRSGRSPTRSAPSSCSTPPIRPGSSPAVPIRQPGRRGRRGDLHHPQDAARPPRRRHPVRGRPGQEDRQRRLPRPPGWPARARHRGQGGGLRRGGPARVPHLRRPGGGQRRRPRPGARRPRASAWCRAAPTTTRSWSTCAPSTPSSPARWPRRCSTGPGSPATATRSPTTPARPSSPRACAWARRPRPRPGMGGPRDGDHRRS